MDKEFYHLAVRLMDNISRVEPNLVSGHDAEMCVILTDRQHVYAGITGVRISSGQLMRACPEFNAIMSMFPSGETRVEKMITVSFADHRVSSPCEGCLELLLRVDPANADTLIYDRSNHYITASELSAGYAIHDRLTDPFVQLGNIPAVEKEAAAEAAPQNEFDAPNAFEVSAEEEPPVPTLDSAAFEAPIAPPEEFVPADAFGPSEGLAPEEAAPAPEEVAEAAAPRPTGIPQSVSIGLAEAAAAVEDEAQEPEDQFAQFGFEAGESRDFVNEVRADKNNPFYEEPPAPAEMQQNDGMPPYMRDPRTQKPKYLYEQPRDNAQQPAMGYEDPQRSMYASQPLPGQRGQAPYQPSQPQYAQSGQQPFQPGQQQYAQPGYSQQQSQYAQSQYAQSQYTQQPYQPGQSAPYQPGQPQQPYQPGQSAPYQPGQPQYAQPGYAQQPFTPGQNSSHYYAQPQQPYQPQQPSRPEGGSAFRQRLNAFMNDDSSHTKPSGKDATKAEMLRLAKEKKKRAKIDADFKKEMKKRGY